MDGHPAMEREWIAGREAYLALQQEVKGLCVELGEPFRPKMLSSYAFPPLFDQDFLNIRAQVNGVLCVCLCVFLPFSFVFPCSF